MSRYEEIGMGRERAESRQQTRCNACMHACMIALHHHLSFSHCFYLRLYRYIHKTSVKCKLPISDWVERLKCKALGKDTSNDMFMFMFSANKMKVFYMKMNKRMQDRCMLHHVSTVLVHVVPCLSIRSFHIAINAYMHNTLELRVCVCAYFECGFRRVETK